MPAKRTCAQPGCPVLIDRHQRRCAHHTREADQARGSRADRGYGSEHTALRAAWAPRVATGTVVCWRCHLPIAPDAPWHLGHLDDRRHYGGPEHRDCNLSAAGKAAHAR